APRRLTLSLPDALPIFSASQEFSCPMRRVTTNVVPTQPRAERTGAACSKTFAYASSNVRASGRAGRSPSPDSQLLTSERVTAARSEEHTSELQSLRHLV